MLRMIFIASISLFLLTSLASAEVLEIQPTSVHFLQSPGENSVTRAMVRFDLSDQVGSKVLSAYMDWDLDFDSAQAEQGEGLAVKYRVLQAQWNESTGTWAELDTFAGDANKKEWLVSAGEEETVRLDMTDVVTSWVKFPNTNHGLVIELEGDVLEFDGTYEGAELKEPTLRVWIR